MDDLVQESVALFLRRAPRWFAQPPTVSLEAQAWSLLAFCLRNCVTAWDRRHDHIDDDDVDRFEHPEADAEASILDAEQARRRVGGLERQLSFVENPVYRMLLVVVYVRKYATAGLFEEADAHRAGGGRAFVRPWEAAWDLIEARRRERWKNTPWRRHVACSIRCSDPIDAVSDADASMASGWLNRTLSRARVDIGLPAHEPDAPQ